ncbi:MAG: enterochelin esterase-like enzyme [Rhodospirillales bacterium]|nr:enterochelin esterase-like enzyme [Rhodospirillales bacterium]
MKPLIVACTAFLALSAANTACARETATTHPVLQVQLAPSLSQASSGRLLVFARPLAAAKAEAKDGAIDEVDTNFMDVEAVSVAAREVARIAPGETVDIDLDGVTFPDGFSQLAPGLYAVQAVLDVNHSYAYSGRSGGDLISPVVELKLPLDGAKPIALDHTVLPFDPWSPPRASDRLRADLQAARPSIEAIDFTSPSLTKFWGRPIKMRGWVVLPPDYAKDPKRRYPTVFYTHGFSGNADHLTGTGATRYAAMRDGKAPPMIWVLLDQSTATGTHEFADSVNNGPWQHALVDELIPDLEARYRMDARPSGRFLTGHSSGGWATLWLMVNQPKRFGGTWSTSPDPSDFRDFTGIDLTIGENVYRKSDGTLRPLIRDKGKVVGTLRSFALYEETQGEYGGQMRAFEWVFSPRGVDGRPLPLFDRVTGDVDPAVAAYWRANFDVARRLQTRWPELKKDLDGKIHIAVGTADTFYLDGPARKLEAVMQSLGAKTDFRYLAGKTHFDLYKVGDENSALLNDFAWEMYAVARPKEMRRN